MPILKNNISSQEQTTHGDISNGNKGITSSLQEIRNNNNNNNNNSIAATVPVQSKMTTTTVNGDLFGGMEVVRIRHKKRGASTTGSQASLAESFSSFPVKDTTSLSLTAPSQTESEVDKPFFMRFKIRQGNLQDEVEDPQVTRMRLRLERFYNEYNPSELSHVESTIKTFLGREEELFKQLVASYGPEPQVLQASVLPLHTKNINKSQSETGSAFEFITGRVKPNHDNVNTTNISGNSEFSFLKGEKKNTDERQETSVSNLNLVNNSVENGLAFDFTVPSNETINSGFKFISSKPVGIVPNILNDDNIQKEKEEEEKIEIKGNKDQNDDKNSSTFHLVTYLKSNNNNNEKENDGTFDMKHNNNNNNKEFRTLIDENNLKNFEKDNNDDDRDQEENEEEEETMWERHRREIRDAQGDVLLARSDLAKVLNDVCNSIQQRREAMLTVTKLEECIEECVAKEDFEQAETHSKELERISTNISQLDAAPSQLLISFTQYRQQLEEAVHRLAQLLQHHRKELMESKDDEERRVRQFIRDMTFTLENKNDKVAAAMERAERTERNASQEAANLREQKLKLGEKLMEQSKELRTSQKQLLHETEELDTEIASLEIKLTKLKQLRVEKASVLQEVEIKLKRMIQEQKILEGEVDSLIAEEEKRLSTAAADLIQLQQERDLLNRETNSFEAKREELLTELQSASSKMDIYAKREALLETETLESVQDYSSILKNILQLRKSGYGILFNLPPLLTSSSSLSNELKENIENSPLSRVHNLQQQIYVLDAENERCETLISSLEVQIGEMKNNLPILEAAKRAAAQGKRFKEAQLKAEEIRALSTSISELTLTSESTQKQLCTNKEKCIILQKELEIENRKASVKVREFINQYRKTLSEALNITSYPPNVLQLSVEEQGNDDLAEATKLLLTTLQEECEAVPEFNEHETEKEPSINEIPTKNNVSEKIEIQPQVELEQETKKEVEEDQENIESNLLELRQQQAVALEIEDFEECERLQHQIEILEEQLGTDRNK